MKCLLPCTSLRFLRHFGHLLLLLLLTVAFAGHNESLTEHPEYLLVDLAPIQAADSQILVSWLLCEPDGMKSGISAGPGL